MPHVKWTVNLVIADDHVIFLRGLCGYVWANTHTHITPRVKSGRKEVRKDILRKGIVFLDTALAVHLEMEWVDL